MTDTPHVADTAPHDWKYISEGGSTIVFSYAGPPHPQFDGTALRLRKRPTPAHEDAEKHGQPQPAAADEGQENEDEDEGQEDEGEDEPDDPTVVFQRVVIERLLPAEHLPRLDAVRVGHAWLAALARATEPLRPPERRAKDAIDVRRRKAVLATDLVGGEGWAVEIKPKWGFLPAPTHLSPATRPIKTRTCRFCMHAHLKSTQGEDVALGYCPLDLFSGDAPRVRRALRALWDAWLGAGGAVNNLRVFVRGRMVKPTVDPASVLPLAEQLFPAPAALPRTRPLDALRDAFLGALLPLLLRTPVLRALGTLQRTLDALDVEGLAALWAARRTAAPELGRGERDPDIAEWARFVDEYRARRDALAEEQLGRGGERQEGEGEGEGGEGGVRVHATEEELRFRLAAYLLSASFKDCSLILRLKPDPDPAPDSHAPTDEDGDGDGAYAGGARPVRQTGTVAVIDLDVKGVGRLAKWAALDRAIVDAYRGVAPRDCQDAWRPAS